MIAGKTATDLDVEAPDEVSNVLRAAALAYGESAQELSSTWQDLHNPMIWSKIASVLDSAANEIDKEVKSHFSMPIARVSRRKKIKGPPTSSPIGYLDDKR